MRLKEVEQGGDRFDGGFRNGRPFGLGRAPAPTIVGGEINRPRPPLLRSIASDAVAKIVEEAMRLWPHFFHES